MDINLFYQKIGAVYGDHQDQGAVCLEFILLDLAETENKHEKLCSIGMLAQHWFGLM